MDEMWHGWNCICGENGHHPYWLICIHVIKLHASRHNFYPYFYYIYAFNFINIIKFHSCGIFLNCHPHGCVLTFFHVMDVIDVSNYIRCDNFHSSTNFIHVVSYTPLDHQYLPTLVHANPSIINYQLFISNYEICVTLVCTLHLSFHVSKASWMKFGWR